MSVDWRTRMARLLQGKGSRGTGLELGFYTRADCPLCEAMEEALAAVRWRRIGVDAARVRVERRDVDSRESWRLRYGLAVPVLEHDGRPLAKGRTSREELEKRLARRLAQTGRGIGDG